MSSTECIPRKTSARLRCVKHSSRLEIYACITCGFVPTPKHPRVSKNKRCTNRTDRTTARRTHRAASTISRRSLVYRSTRARAFLLRKRDRCIRSDAYQRPGYSPCGTRPLSCFSFSSSTFRLHSSRCRTSWRSVLRRSSHVTGKLPWKRPRCAGHHASLRTRHHEHRLGANSPCCSPCPDGSQPIRPHTCPLSVPHIRDHRR